MCKPKPGAPSMQRVIAYTVDSPFSKDKPGFVASVQPNPNETALTSDMWLAKAMDRAEWERWLPLFKRHTKKELYTHEAFVAFVKP